MNIWRVVCQKRVYFTASLCNAGLGNSWLAWVINKCPEIYGKIEIHFRKFPDTQIYVQHAEM